jgi:predicted GTPase
MESFFCSVQSRFLTSSADEESRNAFSQQIQQYIVQNGTQNFDEFIKSIMEKKCKEPLRIAITGGAGVGKSTFINTIRGLSPTDSGAAKTNSMSECTMAVEKCPDPRNPNLIYYDLPGYGSQKFPTNEYMGKLLLDRYDFFIIFSHNSFTDNDCYLAEELNRLGKKFYFVRTRIDESINNERGDTGDSFDELVYLDQVRQVSKQNVGRFLGLRSVFVISGRLQNYAKWDFPDLVRALMDDAPDIKKEILIRTITANSQEGIDRKAALLEQRIFLIAIAAATVATLPVPVLSMPFETIVIAREVHQYMKDFGLDEESMKSLAKTLRMDYTDLEKIVFGASNVLHSNRKSAIESVVMATLGKTAVVSAVGECAKIAPVFGQALSSTISFVTVESALQSLLNETKLLAIKLVQQLTLSD